MDAELLLEDDLQVEDGAVGARGLRHETRELPELGLLLARGRAEGGRVDSAEALGEDPEARAAEQLSGPMANLLEILRPFDEDVGDREGVIQRERRVVSALTDLLGPDPGRDVDQEAAAVPLAVDIAGAVEHLLQRLEREGDRLVAGGGVAAHGGIERAGVLVLHARRRDERAVSALR